MNFIKFIAELFDSRQTDEMPFRIFLNANLKKVMFLFLSLLFLLGLISNHHYGRNGILVKKQDLSHFSDQKVSNRCFCSCNKTVYLLENKVPLKVIPNLEVLYQIADCFGMPVTYNGSTMPIEQVRVNHEKFGGVVHIPDFNDKTLQPVAHYDASGEKVTHYTIWGVYRHSDGTSELTNEIFHVK